MDGLASLLFPQAPSYAEGLLGAEEAQRLQSQAQRSGLLNLGLGLLAAGAPSAVRTGTGAGLVQGLMAGQEAYQRTYQQRLQEMEMMRKLQEQQRAQQMQQAVQQLGPQALAGNQEAFSQLAQFLGPEQLAKFATAAKTAQEMRTPAKPELREVGGALYEIVPGQAPKLVINAKNEFTGDFANVANRLFGTANVGDLTVEQRNQIMPLVESLRRSGAASTTTTVFPPGAVAPGTSAQNKIDEALLSSGSRLQVLDRLSQQYKPEFLQTRFRVSQELVGLGEKLGREPSPEERQNLEQFSRFKQDAVRQLNQYINEITGAAIGQGEEAERLKSGVPNPGTGLFGGDSPTEFASKLSNTIRDLRLAEARLQYIKSQGFKIQDVKLEDMPNIMRKRKEQIVKDFGLDENDPQAREVIKNRLASEFGLLR